MEFQCIVDFRADCLFHSLPLILLSYLPMYLYVPYVYIHVYMCMNVCIYLSIYQSIYLFYTAVCLHNHLPIYLPTHLSVHILMYLSMYACMCALISYFLPHCLPFYPFIYLPLFLAFYQSIYPKAMYLSGYGCMNATIHLPPGILSIHVPNSLPVYITTSTGFISVQCPIYQSSYFSTHLSLSIYLSWCMPKNTILMG